MKTTQIKNNFNQKLEDDFTCPVNGISKVKLLLIDPKWDEVTLKKAIEYALYGLQTKKKETTTLFARFYEMKPGNTKASLKSIVVPHLKKMLKKVDLDKINLMLSEHALIDYNIKQSYKEFIEIIKPDCLAKKSVFPGSIPLFGLSESSLKNVNNKNTNTNNNTHVQGLSRKPQN